MNKRSKNYSATKGDFIQQQMNEGSSNKTARKEWNEKHDLNFLSGARNGPIGNESGEHVDRSHESPMQDWAETSEDF